MLRLRHALGRLDRLKDWERSARTGMASAVTTEPCADLLRLLGEPQRRYEHIHVAGSKGKGSTSALLGAALEEGGWRTAVLSSPHVECITERVRINGEPIDAGALADSLEAALAARTAAEAGGTTGAHASWFDVFVAASLHACAEARVGWAVVECGLGGRCDSTNVLGAQLAVLTGVELEHTEVLGNTLEAIAAEKAAIASPGGALVACVSPALYPVVRAVARARRVRTCTVLPRSEDPLSDNLELARLALDELGRRGVICAVPSSATGRAAPSTSVVPSSVPGHADPIPRRIGRGLLSAPQVERARRALPARQELLLSACGTPVLLDAAHTPASAQYLARSVLCGAIPVAGYALSSGSLLVSTDGPTACQLAGDRAQASVMHGVRAGGAGGAAGAAPAAPTPPVLLVGMLEDKDHAAVATALGSLSPIHAVCVALASAPADGASEQAVLRVRDAVVRAGCASVSIAPDAARALDEALDAARRHKTWVLVAGSFRLCGAVRPLLSACPLPG